MLRQVDVVASGVGNLLVHAAEGGDHVGGAEGTEESKSDIKNLEVFWLKNLIIEKQKVA